MSTLYGPIQFPPGISTTNMNSSSLCSCLPRLAVPYTHEHTRISQSRQFTQTEEVNEAIFGCWGLSSHYHRTARVCVMQLLGGIKQKLSKCNHLQLEYSFRHSLQTLMDKSALKYTNTS